MLKDVYEKYKSDSCDKGCDKGTAHSYIDVYERMLSKYVGNKAVLLEIGTASGLSLLMWNEYLRNGEIHGVDVCEKPKVLDGQNSITYHRVDVSNVSNFDAEIMGIALDIVIDDGSHRLSDQLLALCILWPRVKTGGIYVIEDIYPFENTRCFSCFGWVDVCDLRAVKKRQDDVLVVMRK